MSMRYHDSHEFDDDDDDEDELELTLIKSRSEASSPWGHPIIPTTSKEKRENDEDSDADSDAEFAVHPILRSLIKSKSAYTVPITSKSNMRSSKTTFEMNLSKMWASTNESILTENEAPVVNCSTIRLEEKWPEPEDDVVADTKEKKGTDKLFKPSGCWSSPPNVVMDDNISITSYDSTQQERISCWSAPEYGDNDDTEFDDDDDDDDDVNDDVIVEVEEDEHGVYEQDENLDPLIYQPHLLFSTSYPVIETPDPVSSLCSIRLPSSSGSVPSPSPPRPLSPVLGKPGARMSTSRSLQLRPRPRLEELLYDDITQASDDDVEDDDDEDSVWPQKDPWPEQEVWPEDRIFSHHPRNSWVDNEIPRSVSVQFRPQSHTRPLPNSYSAHGHIHKIESSFVEDSEIHLSVDDQKMTASQNTSSANSSTQMLSETERFELVRRSAWLERGSLVQLSNGSDYQSLQIPSTSNQIRRSCTTDEFRRPRRRLPRRPDDVGYRGDLPYSMSMYDKCLYEEQCNQRFGLQRAQSLRSSTHFLKEDSEPVILCSSPMALKPRPPSSLPIAEPGSVQFQTQSTPTSQPAVTSVGAHSTSYQPYSSNRSATRQAYADLATPMSPPKHLLPSPHSTGRRLPPLPLNSTYLARFPTMNVPPPAPVPKNDHTLCFIDGMTDSVLARSTFEESYYEDDSINGNSSYRRQRKSFFSPDDSSGVSSCTTSDSVNPTHRVQSSFIPRHHDELLLDIGDAVHVERTCEDHWCYGTNLRTNQSGIFPSAVVCEIDLVEEICLGALPTNANKVLTSERDTFYLTMLASIEVAHHKGNDVLTQAMNKVLALYKNREEIIVPQTVLMEISFRGIHVIDKRKKNFFQCPTFDFFYSLQNISFCGAHPKQLKYFGFITKHPLLPRFACHVFMSNMTTQPIVESIGRAFKRSYDEYMAFAHPTEDIYLE